MFYYNDGDGILQTWKRTEWLEENKSTMPLSFRVIMCYQVFALTRFHKTLWDDRTQKKHGITRRNDRIF